MARVFEALQKSGADGTPDPVVGGFLHFFNFENDPDCRVEEPPPPPPPLRLHGYMNGHGVAEDLAQGQVLDLSRDHGGEQWGKPATPAPGTAQAAESPLDEFAPYTAGVAPVAYSVQEPEADLFPLDTGFAMNTAYVESPAVSPAPMSPHTRNVSVGAAAPALETAFAGIPQPDYSEDLIEEDLIEESLIEEDILADSLAEPAPLNITPDILLDEIDLTSGLAEEPIPISM
ncbi:MAG: hypothetical protein ACKV2V_30770, partial [Blastocatellia bacterium]